MKAEVNSVLTGQWAVQMMSSPGEKPMTCLYGFCCPCCFAYQQRQELLDMTSEPYVCCAGMCPCCCFGQPCQDRNPWLCLETCCCTNNAIIGNRFMLQTRFNIRNDPCDDTLLGIIACINVLACIIAIFADRDTARLCEDCAECVNAMVCACMLTQQDIQINAIKESGVQFQQIPQQIFIVLPPQQQQMLNGFAQMQPTAPAQAPPQYGAMAAGAPKKKLLVTVPVGIASGQMIQAPTPEGGMVQVVVPPGVGPGQQFEAEYS